jgi:hypothetical protein
VVYGSDGAPYISTIGSNIGNDPTTDDANWRSLLLSTDPSLLENFGFTAAVATKALTFALKTKALTDPTSTDKVNVAFRSATLTTGSFVIIASTSAASIVVPDGATLGFDPAGTDYIYLYGINNAGAMELSVSGSLLDETVLHTTVAIDATADSDTVLYSTTARTDAPIRLLGRIKIETGAVAGEWDNAHTELYVGEPALNNIPIDSSTHIVTTSGTDIPFTGIPAWAKKVTVMFSGVSTNGSSIILLQLGDSGGIEATGYLGTANEIATHTRQTTGIGISGSNAADRVYHGTIILTNFDGDEWIATGVFGTSAGAAVASGQTGFSKTLSGTLTQLNLTTVSGTDTFDAGAINILYE